jgi:hypothetical protein
VTTHLPLIRPAAIKTTFVHAAVPVGAGLVLHVDGNSKVTAGNGTYDEPRPNALSLPAASVQGQGVHCPQSTPACRESCYVKGLAQHAPELYALYQDNFDTLMHLLVGPVDKRWNAACALAGWIDEHCVGGFRWHVSGDVLNLAHAKFIARVARLSPNVSHWIYTRTLDVVPWLCDAGNLAVNISCDADNYEAAREAYYGVDDQSVRLAYLTVDGTLPSDLPLSSIIFPDYSLRGRSLSDPTSHAWWQGLSQEHRRMVCPTDFFGQSEQHRCGPCRKCL